MSKDANDKIEKALFDFYLEADKASIKESLKTNVNNLAEYDKKKKQIIFMAKALANKKHDEYLLTLVSKFEEAILQNIEKPVAILKQLIQTNPSLALYRNLDKLSKENIIEIIKDKNLVELLEQLEISKDNEGN
jgi:hypothetical protein